MRQENFLRTLTAGHHEILLLCREIREEALKIRSDGAMGSWEALSAEVRGALKDRVLPHMLAEDRLIDKFSYLLGRTHPTLERMKADHQRLRDLLHTGSLDTLSLFARVMEEHVLFEEDQFFTLLQETLSDAEKSETARLLDKELSGDLQAVPQTHQPLNGGRLP